MKQKRRFRNRPIDASAIRTFIIIAVMLALLTAQLIKNPTITYSTATFLNYIIKTIMSVASIGFIAAGVTLSIMTGNIDLSTGATLTLTAIVSCTLSVQLYNLFGPVGSAVAAIIIPIAVGALCGAFNGFLVGKLHLNAFVTTLSTSYVFQAAAVAYNGGRTVNAMGNPFYQFFGNAKIGSIPFPIILLIVTFLALGFMLQKTVFGQRIYAVGGNRRAATYSGIDPDRVIWITYIITGIMSAIAGIFISSWTMTADMLIGTNKEFNAITAVVVGGTMLTGGTGKISGTFVGVLFMGILDMFYITFGISNIWQWVIKGIILIIVLYVNGVLESNQSRRKVL